MSRVLRSIVTSLAGVAVFAAVGWTDYATVRWSLGASAKAGDVMAGMFGLFFVAGLFVPLVCFVLYAVGYLIFGRLIDRLFDDHAITK